MKKTLALSALMLGALASTSFAQSNGTSQHNDHDGSFELKTGFSVPSTLVFQASTDEIRWALDPQVDLLNWVKITVKLNTTDNHVQVSCAQVADALGLNYQKAICNVMKTEKNQDVLKRTEAYDRGTYAPGNILAGEREFTKTIHVISYKENPTGTGSVDIYGIKDSTYVETYRQTYTATNGGTYEEDTFAPIMVGDITTFIPITVVREYPYRLISTSGTTPFTLGSTTLSFENPPQAKLMCVSKTKSSMIGSESFLGSSFEGVVDINIRNDTSGAAALLSACVKDPEATLVLQIDGVAGTSATNSADLSLQIKKNGVP